MKIKLADCYKEDDIDYIELGLLESHLAHEVGRLSNKGFVEKYKDVEKWEKEFGLLGHPYMCDMLRAMVEYYAAKIGEPILFNVVNTCKYVVEPYTAYLIANEDTGEQLKLLESLWDNSISIYKRHHLLWDDVQIAVNDKENTE